MFVARMPKEVKTESRGDDWKKKNNGRERAG